MLGIITARGGSERIPRKNIKDFLGKPLLNWSIETGKASGIFDKFILSTDDEEMAAIGRAAGIEVPFMRPNELATNTSSSLDVLKHAIAWLKENEGYTTEWVILLEPSSPGRQAIHIREVAELIKGGDRDIDSIVGITETPGHFSPHKALIQDERGMVSRLDGTLVKNLTHRTQNIPKTYHINSSVYAFKVSNFLDASEPSLWGERTLGYLMDSKYSLDIDTQDDWDLAEFKMGKLLGKK